jgi:hypothetical protein
VRESFYIERQGKRFVLYAGLLEAAHNEGLHEIETNLLQIPTPENNEVAIVGARVTMEKDGELRTFSGIGDASPENVGKNIKPHLIRMAETRAKARALRDAVNISAQILEDA